MKKINVCLAIVSIICTPLALFASEKVVAKNNESTQFKSDKSLNQSLPNGDVIDHLWQKYQNETQASKKQFYLVAIAEEHSGLANLLLAKSANVPVNKKINYYLEAAKYGYKEAAYQGIASLYKAGVGVEKNELLSNCYLNLAKANPSRDLVTICHSNYPNGFIVVANYPLQSSTEIIRKANDDYSAFCKNFSQHNLFNPEIDAKEQTILANRFCHIQSPKYKGLKYSDVVIKDNNLYQYTQKGYIPYHKKLENGFIAYRINPPMSLYIYNKDKFLLAHNGDKVIKDSKAYIVQNNQLVKYQ